MRSSIAAGAALALQGCATMPSPISRVRGANEDIRVAVVGFRSKGAQLVGVFDKLDGVRVVALCDPDREILSREVHASSELSSCLQISEFRLKEDNECNHPYRLNLINDPNHAAHTDGSKEE